MTAILPYREITPRRPDCVAGALRGARVDFEFAAAQLFPKMLAQRLLVDLELIGDFGLGDANGRSALDEGALFGSRLIFGWHFL